MDELYYTIIILTCFYTIVFFVIYAIKSFVDVFKIRKEKK